MEATIRQCTYASHSDAPPHVHITRPGQRHPEWLRTSHTGSSLRWGVWTPERGIWGDEMYVGERVTVPQWAEEVNTPEVRLCTHHPSMTRDHRHTVTASGVRVLWGNLDAPPPAHLTAIGGVVETDDNGNTIVYTNDRSQVVNGNTGERESKDMSEDIKVGQDVRERVSREGVHILPDGIKVLATLTDPVITGDVMTVGCREAYLNEVVASGGSVDGSTTPPTVKVGLTWMFTRGFVFGRSRRFDAREVVSHTTSMVVTELPKDPDEVANEQAVAALLAVNRMMARGSARRYVLALRDLGWRPPA